MATMATMSDKAEQFQLVKSIIADELGGLAASIVEALHNYGTRTLKELSTAFSGKKFDAAPTEDVPGGQVADDFSIKRCVGTLVQHQVASVIDGKGVYGLRLGVGLFRFVFPLVLEHIKATFGEAPETLVRVLFEYGALPIESLHSVAVKRTPALADAIPRSLNELKEAGILILADDDTERAEKRPRLNDGGMPYVLNHQAILVRMRTAMIAQFISTTQGPEAERVVGTMIANDANKATKTDRPFGFPSLAEHTSRMSFSSIARKAEAGLASRVVEETLALLGNEDNGPFVIQHSTHDISASEYTFHYSLVINAMKMTVARDVAFVRHGMVGHRIIRALEDKKALEDRHLAEECITTVTEIRDALRNMMTDGFVMMQEIPKTNSTERLPKHSIVVWVLNPEAMTNAVKSMTAKTAQTLRSRAAFERQQALSQLPRHFTYDPQGCKLTDAHQEIIKGMKARGEILRKGLLAVQENVLLLEFF